MQYPLKTTDFLLPEKIEFMYSHDVHAEPGVAVRTERLFLASVASLESSPCLREMHTGIAP